MQDPPLPTAFGRYQPIEELGAGAMGKVYLAVDPLIDRMVAVKVINMDLAGPDGRAEFLERFRTEVRAAAQCAHPAIVSVYDFSDDDKVPYIVMEFVPGVTLSTLMRQPPAERQAGLPDLSWLLLQVLEGLAAAHAVGVVHRDIKPGNIMVTPRGAVKITDFGIARLGDSTMTLVGGLVGSPSYMSPEQALGKAVDHRTDLFSIAAVLYQILLGRTPFGGSGITDTLVRLGGAEPAKLGPLEGSALGLVLRRGLEKDVARRFASATEFAAALRLALQAEEEATRILPLAAAPQAAPAPGYQLPVTVAARLTKELAVMFGPTAGVMLRKATEEAKDLPEVVSRLCAQLSPDEVARLRSRLAALN
ncbi:MULTISPECIES: serine/threonine-protein kinase [Roseomonadaceae]|uniref:Serine/threonine protein kinase n=1 Tax=Falsiroseomonas oleicola TaxID=2801474 RepID=A0ABS6HB70_9PROT|nr:serine/threonine-protein kinase [Roseomonas oleicola]MBU8544943.1 serine/threonine protein kinase [Roseomonas oleicola]